MSVSMNRKAHMSAYDGSAQSTRAWERRGACSALSLDSVCWAGKCWKTDQEQLLFDLEFENASWEVNDI